MSESLPNEGLTGDKGPPVSVRMAPARVLLALLITALWGTNPTVLKIAMEGFPPIGSAGLRFVIAAVGVWAWCRLSHNRIRPAAGDWPWLAGNSLFFVVQIATFTLGVYWGSASHSIVLLHTYPFFVVALAHFLVPGDRASWGRVAGLIAAFSGIVALFAGQGAQVQGTQLRGDVIQLVSALILGVQVVFLKRAVERVPPHRMVFWQMAVGAAVFLGYSLVHENLLGATPGAASIGAVVYQGVIIGTLCFTVWTWLLRRHAASAVSIFGFVSPLIGVTISTFALHEPFTPALATSAALVAVGIVLGNLR